MAGGEPARRVAHQLADVALQGHAPRGAGTGHVDSAIAAGPFVTTANDITGILIYFGTATFFLDLLVR